MKFQIEFAEITQGLEAFDVDLAVELADKVCAGKMTRAEAIEKLRS